MLLMLAAQAVHDMPSTLYISLMAFIRITVMEKLQKEPPLS